MEDRIFDKKIRDVSVRNFVHHPAGATFYDHFGKRGGSPNQSAMRLETPFRKTAVRLHTGCFELFTDKTKFSFVFSTKQAPHERDRYWR